MPKVLTVKHMARCIACYSCMLACARAVYGDYSPSHSAVQIRTRGGLQSKLAADVCIGCRDAPCAAACQAGALLPRPGGGVRFVRNKCSGCGACVEACVVRAIRLDADGRAIVCIQCGTCTRFCPHDVLVMEESAADA
ncbi:MAG: 4Fe-4S dicluster domain-containing protein [Bacillota bacterium]|nr:4Fe-4S dicluster domain-containing protein [Bacillota bacterium]